MAKSLDCSRCLRLEPSDFRQTSQPYSSELPAPGHPFCPTKSFPCTKVRSVLGKLLLSACDEQPCHLPHPLITCNHVQRPVQKIAHAPFCPRRSVLPPRRRPSQAPRGRLRQMDLRQVVRRPRGQPAP